MNRLLLLFFGMALALSTWAQSPNVPANCQDLNLSVDANGMARFMTFDFLTNATLVSGEITITRSFGEVIYGPAPSSNAIPIVIPVCAYLREALKLTFTNQAGSCWSKLTFKQSNGPILQGRSKDIWCFDPLVGAGDIDDQAPQVVVPCGPTLTTSFVADWITPYECTVATPQNTPESDTTKLIYREYEAFYKGNRITVLDTLVVFRLPIIIAGFSGENTYCAESDTTYCGEGFAGPFMIIPERCDPALFGMDQDGDGVACDTLYFMVYDDSMQMWVENPIFAESKCGLSIHLDQWAFGSSCETQYKFKLELKQNCYGRETGGICSMVTSDNAFRYVSPNPFTGPGEPLYLECEFWMVDLDTLPPVVDCKDDNLLLTTVYTNSHECAAHTYVPPAYVSDDWSGIKQVKATIENIGTTVMTYNAEKECYEGHTQFKLPHRVLPYRVLYEAYDSCHNIGLDSCYIRVKDRTRPIAVADKGVTVSLSDKKIWVDAETFDEGSWDNCGVNMLLARRTDWYDFCVDLCDSLDYCWIGEHGDTIWQSYLEDDKHVDEVEAHYAKTLEWLCDDNQLCGDVIYNAWQYDLMKHATLDCVDHPYDVDEDYFRELINHAVQEPEFAFKWKNPSTLFVGSANNASGADNNAYYVQMNGTATSVLDTFPIWGATTDLENSRILFTTSFGSSNGNQLYALPFGGSQPVKLGTITSDGTTPLRMDGLAYKEGKLYGALDNGVADGIYAIDLVSLVATKLITYSEISGIDTDPISGKIYGADDDNRKIVEIDVVSGSITPVADYPIGETDIDGVAVGAGKIFLVTDEPGSIHVYNIVTNSYDNPILSPFAASDIFSGGAAYMPMLEDLIDEWSQIGGGWSDAVPFSCDDACGPVTVEILVMDYWCNWSTAWTKVWVEDKTPIKIAKDVIDEEVITCKVYKDNNYAYPGEEHPVSIQYIVDQAKAGEQSGYDALDGIFGGYCKAWIDPYGNYVDIEGEEIDCDIPFYDSICDCKDTMIQVRVYDDHLGYLWKDSVVRECYYDGDTINFQKGIVAVNCADNVQCEQEVWCEFDHCGKGYIFRKFKIWQGCPEGSYEGLPDSLRHPVDTIFRHQRIWVGNECELDKYMFDVPYDTEVYSCEIQYGPDGNIVGVAGPENTGYATYKFDDDCRIVGIAHEDKVFKIVGGDAACYKILRTWYFADWCTYGGDVPDGAWWLDDGIVTAECIQKIIVKDTIAPICVITGPVGSGDSVSVAACTYNLEVTVDAMDACGLNTYYWELKDITKDDDHVLFDSGNGALDGDKEDDFAITSEGLYPGDYKLKVRIQDACTNESYCEYLITVLPGKKPAPVCITSITARLTPWDSDGDGEIDSAHAVVWASEFDRSSLPACDDDSLEFRIELLDDIDDDAAAGDTDYLELGCDEIGSKLARLWVISHPSGSSDFCDVVLIVQSDFSGCSTTTSSTSASIKEDMDMTHIERNLAKNRIGDRTTVTISADVGSHLSSELAYGLKQNNPNPFRQQTEIGFTLPESMDASIQVFDVTGRLLKSIQGYYTKGYNVTLLRKSDLQGAGVLYYRLQAGDFVATKRMILIE